MLPCFRIDPHGPGATAYRSLRAIRRNGLGLQPLVGARRDPYLRHIRVASLPFRVAVPATGGRASALRARDNQLKRMGYPPQAGTAGRLPSFVAPHDSKSYKTAGRDIAARREADERVD
jgi:hypothetical protein